MNSSISESTDKTATITESNPDAIINDEPNSVQVVFDNSETTTELSSTDAFEPESKRQKLDVDVASSSNSEVENSSKDSSPLFTVSFRDKNVAKEYRECIKEYLENYVSKNSELSLNCQSDLLLEVWKNDFNYKSREFNEKIENSQNSEENDLLFTIDKQPAPKDDLNIPTYGKKYNKVYEKASEETLQQAQKDKFISKIECFNCLGNHSLRDCTQPLDNQAICKNRKGFSMNNNRATRYHLDNEQRFGHLVPGSLSKNLRKALGLKDNQLPRHIYRMRILGYPPGWLEEARLQHSGITLFNSDGVAETDPTEEPGEIFVDPGDKDQYDIKKIYDFPGFNVLPPPGTRDEYKQHWAPQMQSIHSKETMLSMLQGKKAEDGYKRKKLKVSTTTSTAVDCQTTSIDMDLEEDMEVAEVAPVNGNFVPPLPKDTPTVPPLPKDTAIVPPLPKDTMIVPPLPSDTPTVPPSLENTSIKPPEPPTVPQLASEDSDAQSQEPLSPNSDNDESTAPSSRTNSPSLSDLEHMKKRLLVALEDSSSQSNPGTPVRNDSTRLIDTKGETTPQMNRSQDSNSLNTSQGSVKSIDLGTPVLQSTSPYSKLPSSEKFSKNICDVITYENLPDSTGKYVQLTGILQKVRDTLAKIHQDS